MKRAHWLVGSATAVGVTLVLTLAGSRASGGDAPARPSADASAPAVAMSVAEEQATAGMLVDRVQLFRTGNLGARFRLDGPQMTALLRHAAPGMIPAGVTDPVVTVRGDALQVEARVARHDVLPPRDGFVLPDILPDTVRVVLHGGVASGPGDQIVFTVRGARVGRIPLPRAVIAAVVAELPGGSSGDGGATPSRTSNDPAITVRAPAGIGEVSIVDGEVVFFRIEPFADRAVDGSDP